MSDFTGNLFLLSLAIFAYQFITAVVFTMRVSNSPRSEAPHIRSVSVVIPFYNERKRIEPLLKSLNEQRNWYEGLELIFVDDGSNDQCSEFIHTCLKRPFKLIRLEHKSGKKAAIHQGILQARHEFILTLDADVVLSKNYVEYLMHLPRVDMVILPVHMKAKSFLQHLFSVEFIWLQQLTFGAKKPVLCNGANLFFRKSAYLETVNQRNDFDIASGDDTFLLEAFLKKGKVIERIYEPDLEVETPAPVGLKELLTQRRRWIGKWKHMDGELHRTHSILMIAVQLNFLVSVIAFFFNPLFLISLAVKWMAEFFVTLNRDLGDIVLYAGLLIVHQVWYPIYLLLLLFPQRSDERWQYSKE